MMFNVAEVTARLTSVLSLRAIGLDGMQIDVVEGNIGTLVDEVVPERGLDLGDVLNQHILRVVDCPRNWTGFTSRVPSLEKSEKSILKEWKTYYHRCRCKCRHHKCGCQNPQSSMLCRRSGTSEPPRWTSSTISLFWN